jgi:hypothetical protein
VNKNELDLQVQKLNASTRNLTLWLGAAQHLCTVIGTAVVVWLIFDGLKGIVAARPDSLTALAAVVDKMQLGSWVGT